MSTIESEEEKQVVKQFLNLSVSSVHHRLVPNSNATLALCLNHPLASVRINAITYMMENFDSVSFFFIFFNTFLFPFSIDF